MFGKNSKLDPMDINGIQQRATKISHSFEVHMEAFIKTEP